MDGQTVWVDVAHCTGCGACLLVCPDFCFEVYRYETPVVHEVGE